MFSFLEALRPDLSFPLGSTFTLDTALHGRFTLASLPEPCRAPRVPKWSLEKHGFRRCRTARIAGSGLDPYLIECTVSQDFAVGDTIQGNTTRKAEVSFSRFARERAGKFEDDLLCHLLH